MVALPKRRLSLYEKELTITGFDVQSRQPWTKITWVDLGDEVAIPRAFAISVARLKPVYARGFEVTPPSRATLKDEQGPLVADTVARFRTASDLLLQARTGSGKTVMGVEIGARLNASTLILVDQEKLMRQWQDTLTSLFGYKARDIGRVQGSVVDFEHDFTIGMIQSIYDYDFTDEFYQAFGLVIYDECHVCGAEKFSNVLQMFPARYRLGMSATPDRKDELKKLLTLHLEQDRVVLATEHKKSKVYVVHYPGTYSWYGNISPKTGRFISEVTQDHKRNLMLIEIIKWFHSHGRKTLIIGERIEHLEGLRALAVASGVPEEDTVMYTGKENVWRYRKNPEPTKDPYGHVKGTIYTPIAYGTKERKVKLADRDALLETKMLVFSTYSVFSKGVDAPGIEAGLDVTPRSGFVQVHGRILRDTSGKRIPIWVTIRDYNSFRAEHQFAKRLEEFSKSNAEIYLWEPGKETVYKKDQRLLLKEAVQRNKILKDAITITGPDGNCMLQTPLTGPVYSRSKGTTTTGKKGN